MTRQDGSAIAQKLGEHDGVVVLAVARRVEDRSPDSSRRGGEARRGVRMGGELVAIANPELRKSGGDMVEPLRNSSLGASSRAHSSRLARACETPRGQT